MGGARSAVDHLTLRTDRQPQTVQVTLISETLSALVAQLERIRKATAMQRGSDAEVCGSCAVKKKMRLRKDGLF